MMQWAWPIPIVLINGHASIYAVKLKNTYAMVLMLYFMLWVSYIYAMVLMLWYFLPQYICHGAVEYHAAVLPEVGTIHLCYSTCYGIYAAVLMPCAVEEYHAAVQPAVGWAVGSAPCMYWGMELY